MVEVNASAPGSLRTNFDFDRLFDADAVVHARSSGGLLIDVDGLRYGFLGADLSYNSSGEPIAGTIRDIIISAAANGNILFSVFDRAIAAEAFFQPTIPPDNPLLSLILFGDDVLNGGASGDNFTDLLGHNILTGGSDADTITAGDGNDHIYGHRPFAGPDGDDIIIAGGGSDYIQGNAGNDSLDGGGGSDRIKGGQGDDSIAGGPGNDSVNGNLGNDSIAGGGDNDSLRGGQGDDSLDGGSGNDIVMGDLGADYLTGGSGADIFQFGVSGSPAASPDCIVDYVDGTDRIAIGFAPTIILTGDVQPGASAAAAAQALFDGRAGNGEVAALSVGVETYLFYSASGGGTVDSAILLAGVSASVFGTDDFI